MIRDLVMMMSFGVEGPALGEKPLHAGVDPVNPGGNVGPEEREGGLLYFEEEVTEMMRPTFCDADVQLPEVCGLNANAVIGMLDEVEVP